MIRCVAAKDTTLLKLQFQIFEEKTTVVGGVIKVYVGYASKESRSRGGRVGR